MLVKNMPPDLFNGSTGKVIGFCSRYNYKESSPGTWAGPGSVLGGGAKGSIGPPPAKKSKLGSDVQEVELYPVVKFALSDGSTKDWLVERTTFSAEWPNGKIKATRDQVPLILAWALSVHKSQGQSKAHLASSADLHSCLELG